MNDLLKQEGMVDKAEDPGTLERTRLGSALASAKWMQGSGMFGENGRMARAYLGLDSFSQFHIKRQTAENSMDDLCEAGH